MSRITLARQLQSSSTGISQGSLCLFLTVIVGVKQSTGYSNVIGYKFVALSLRNHDQFFIQYMSGHTYHDIPSQWCSVVNSYEQMVPRPMVTPNTPSPYSPTAYPPVPYAQNPLATYPPTPYIQNPPPIYITVQQHAPENKSGGMDIFLAVAAAVLPAALPLVLPLLN